MAAARKNAATHNLTKRCRYYAGDSAKVLSGVLHQRDLRQGAFLVDPPRTGLHADAVRQILRFKPGYILYVSCAPDTLQRDLKKMIEAGYKIVQTGLLDMFPATAHFESLTVLEYTK